MNDFNDTPFAGDPFIKRLSNIALIKKQPFSVTFELTHKCNFACRMCYIKMTDKLASLLGEIKTADEWIEMGSQCKEAGILSVTLTGGECLLYPEFERLYTELHKMGFLVSLMTNASLMDEEFVGLFKKYPPYQVIITLYGTSNETYKSICRIDNGHDKTMRGIELFKQVCKKVSLNFSLIKTNIDEYSDLAKIALELGLPFRQSAVADIHRCGSEFSNIKEVRLSPVLNVFLNYYNPREIAEQAEKIKEIENYLNQNGFPYEQVEVNQNKGRCKGSYTSPAVFWNGEMRSCLTLTSYFTNPFAEGFKKAFEKLTTAADLLFKPNKKCIQCSYYDVCLNCPGRTRPDGIFGNVPDDYMCRYAYAEKIIREQLLK